jgi:hypothetical protein
MQHYEVATSSEEVYVVLLFRFTDYREKSSKKKKRLQREDGLGVVAGGAAASCRGGVVEARKGDSSAVRPGGI